MNAVGLLIAEIIVAVILAFLMWRAVNRVDMFSGMFGSLTVS